ncbi:unnamed protein product [Trifolium pratense]|uniref:Uncharacterized protein n=1 Tax=Trifolium pratense TaxID=57577 RepID=A0ACB0MAY9_TRIPR|nr:unnamed protein product [Trifolium pratense]
MIDNKSAFTTKKDYGRGEREAQWATAQHTLHGLKVTETKSNNSHHEDSEIAEQAKRCAKADRFIYINKMHLINMIVNFGLVVVILINIIILKTIW